MEQNIAEIAGIVEDVLDRNGEESSKSRGVDVLQGKATKKEEKQFLHKGKSVLCACTVTVCSIRIFEYNRLATIFSRVI